MLYMVQALSIVAVVWTLASLGAFLDVDRHLIRIGSAAGLMSRFMRR